MRLNGIRTELLTGTAKSHEPPAPCELLGGVNCCVGAEGWRDDAKVAMDMLLAEDGPTDDVPKTFGREGIAFGGEPESMRGEGAVKCLEHREGASQEGATAMILVEGVAAREQPPYYGALWL
jgi:hypothetical protein